MNLDFNLTEHWPSTIQAIHASEYQAVLAVTGGGSGAMAALLEMPGASRTVLEAHVPYSHQSLCEWIGGTPDQACSEATARAMAMAAWMRARELAPEADPVKLIGLGCTASLATDRVKRGEHRVHVAVQTGAFTRTYLLNFDSGRVRSEEEVLAAFLLLCVLAETAEQDSEILKQRLNREVSVTEAICFAEQSAGDLWEHLLLRNGKMVYVPGQAPLIENKNGALLPGALNPLHEGHLRMAAFAERRLGCSLAWEVSLVNVDKPPLDCLETQRRMEAIRAIDPKRGLFFTDLATFSQKATYHKGCTFVVGIDTILRIDDLKYYANEADRNAAFANIKSAGCGFLVFGRILDGKFQVLSDLSLSPALRELCEEVTAEEFREDISSTELRTDQSAVWL